MSTRSKKRSRKGSTQQDADGTNQHEDEEDNENSAEIPSAPSKPRPRAVRRASAKRLRTDTDPSDVASGDSSAVNPVRESPPVEASPVEASQQRAHAYGTRSANQHRRPGQDVGLNWQEARKEKEAVEAKRAAKKAQDELKKSNAIAKTRREEEGIERLAALERRREQDDDDDDEHHGLTGIARGYLAGSSKAGTAPAQPRPDHHKSKHVAESGSEYEEQPASSSSELDSTSEVESGEDDTGSKLAVKGKKRKTAAEKKREKQKEVRGRIDNVHEALPKNTGGDSAAKARRSQAASAVVANPEANDTFRPMYRALLLQRAGQDTSPATPDHLTKSHAAPRAHDTPAAPLPQLRLRIPSSTPSSRIGTPNRERAYTPVDDDEETRGLNDADVMISRETIVARPRGRQTQALQVVHTEPEPPQKPKAKRTTQADMDPKRSLSAKNVPPWISDDFENIIVPSLLDHYGAQSDPWTVDVKKPTKGKVIAASTSSSNGTLSDLGIVDILQQFIKQLFPRKQYELTSNDIIVRVARQRVANWRRGFLDRAINAVAAGYKQFKVKHPDASKHDVADWANDAMDVKTGFALWEAPPTDTDPKPHGALCSEYVLQTFGPHFKAIQGSLLADSSPPVGALSLALAALDVAFECYESGQPTPLQSNFDQALGGVATEDYLRLAVRPLLDTRDRWDEVMDLAKQYAPRGQGGGKGRASKCRRRTEVMPGSSPTRSDFM
ncbi:hypothetical protein GSI_00682 [Ganoderma sinense ZZ0214-1]|uniref:Uncharacterized protein n=1 Tax=Ganoderma sinense ZZ0214-1 TaxID=1077348 RepID=A0A2G8STA0_9APHY|nr:hypothetical protein GSI_00682 [Ganoderma sinense ZZ0214-1]